MLRFRPWHLALRISIGRLCTCNQSRSFSKPPCFKSVHFEWWIGKKYSWWQQLFPSLKIAIFCSCRLSKSDDTNDPQCLCLQGFYLPQKSSTTCVDIDECRRNQPCGANSVCVNQPGSFNCDCVAGICWTMLYTEQLCLYWLCYATVLSKCWFYQSGQSVKLFHCFVNKRW